jgi:hypothetical protein
MKDEGKDRRQAAARRATRPVYFGVATLDLVVVGASLYGVIVTLQDANILGALGCGALAVVGLLLARREIGKMRRR